MTRTTGAETDRPIPGTRTKEEPSARSLLAASQCPMVRTERSPETRDDVDARLPLRPPEVLVRLRYTIDQCRVSISAEFGTLDLPLWRWGEIASLPAHARRNGAARSDDNGALVGNRRPSFPPRHWPSSEADVRRLPCRHDPGPGNSGAGEDMRQGLHAGCSGHSVCQIANAYMRASWPSSS
jgi:hypothetical protein